MLLARAEAAGVVLLAEATAAVDIGSAMGMGTPQPQLSPWLLLLTVGSLAAQLSPLLLMLAGAKATGAQRSSKVAPSGWNYLGKQMRQRSPMPAHMLQRNWAPRFSQPSHTWPVG